MSRVGRIYGSRDDEIHPFFEKKREWSKFKDKIVGDYIECYLKTIHHRGRPIIIVDAFSGPGSFGDGFDGSPLIICKKVEEAKNLGAKIKCIFSDTRTAHRVELQGCLKEYIENGIAENPLEKFSSALSLALKVGKEATLFFYLDPYGLKGLEFETVRQIYERSKSESTEVLINFSYKTFGRMSGNLSSKDSESSIAKKVKQAKVEGLSRIMGGDYWIDIVTDPELMLDNTKREDAVIGAYVERVRNFFEYTYSIPVKELDNSLAGVPDDLEAKYHLIFGTRNIKGVLYMNDVALNALEPYFDQFKKDNLLFYDMPSRYESCPDDEIKSAIVEAVRDLPLLRPEIYEVVIPRYFMHHLKKDYRAFIDVLTFQEGRLFPNRKTMKIKGRLNDKTLLKAHPWVDNETE